MREFYCDDIIKSVSKYLSFHRCVGKSLLALMVHLIDDKLKLREILIFAKQFSDVSHTAWEIEKAINKDWQVMALENMTCQRHRLLIRCACVLHAFVTVAMNGTMVLGIDHLVGAEFGLDVVHGADFPLYTRIFNMFRSAPL